jgi:mono/diheme cytochrome c family protein
MVGCAVNRGGLLFLGLAAISASAGALAQPAAGQNPPYRIVNGKVDEATFRGWLVYHSACHTCHGIDAIGTEVAPSLVERVKDLSAKQFTIKVITSYRIVFGSGEVRGDDKTAVRERFAEEALRRERGDLVMPAWEHNPDVQPHVLDLYAYLRARADGALAPGVPSRLPKTNAPPVER